MNIEKNKQTIKDFVDFYNNFEVDKMLSLLTEDIEFMNISNDEITVSTKGRDEFSKIAQQANNIFISRKQTITAINELNEMYFVELDFKGKLAIDLPNGMNAGQEISIKGKSEYSFKDNKIAKIVDIS